MRLFFAVYPPTEILAFGRDLLRSLDQHKRNLRPIQVEQQHLTIKFVGPNVSEASASAIIEHVTKRSGHFARPSFQPTNISLGAPRQHNPRVLMLNFDTNPETKLLERQVHSLIRDLHFDDTITWRQPDEIGPHISIARVKQNAGPRIARDLRVDVKKLDLELPSEFTPTEMWAIRSELKSDGPVYTKLGRIVL